MPEIINLVRYLNGSDIHEMDINYLISELKAIRKTVPKKHRQNIIMNLEGFDVGINFHYVKE